MNAPPLPLSAPPWLLTGLHVLTLTLHLVAMNFLLGGLVVLLAARWRRQSELAGRLARALPTVVAATVTLGVAPLLFVQLVYGRQVYAAAIVGGWWWLGIALAVMVGYGLLYRQARLGPRAGLGIVVLALLVYVGLVYTTVFSLAEAPGLQRTLYAASQGGFTLDPRAGEWLPRLLHNLLGALVPGAWFAAWFAGDDADWRLVKVVFWTGLAGTSAAGLVYLLLLGDSLVPFMRGPGIWLTSAGIVLAAAGALLFARRRLAPSGLLLLLSMAGMVGGRQALRLLRLQDELAPQQFAAHPLWGQVALFALFFLVMLAVVAWLVRQARSGVTAIVDSEAGQ